MERMAQLEEEEEEEENKKQKRRALTNKQATMPSLTDFFLADCFLSFMYNNN
jgi:hypothetical protein